MQWGGKLNDILKVCHSVSADNGESCICNRILSARKHLYDLGVVVPVYNAEQHIDECISSILRQKTRYTFHVIVINDGSTDKSREKLKKYETNEFVTVIDQENKEHSGARNTGLENCFGRYVTFVDADDRLPSNAFELLMNEAVKGDYDIVGGGYSRFEGEQELLKALPRQSQLFGFPWGGKFIRRQYGTMYSFHRTIGLRTLSVPLSFTIEHHGNPHWKKLFMSGEETRRAYRFSVREKLKYWTHCILRINF